MCVVKLVSLLQLVELTQTHCAELCISEIKSSCLNPVSWVSWLVTDISHNTVGAYLTPSGVSSYSPTSPKVTLLQNVEEDHNKDWKAAIWAEKV